MVRFFGTASLITWISLGASTALAFNQEQHLKEAVRAGDEAAVRRILVDEKDQNTPYYASQALKLAVELDRIAISTILMDAGGGLWGARIGDQRAIVWLMQQGRMQMFRLVLDRFGPSHLDSPDALWWAVHGDHPEAFARLLKDGFPGNQTFCFEKGPNGRCFETTAVSEAARLKRTSMLEALLAAGFWPGKLTTDPQEVHALYWAAHHQDLPLVNRLIHSGANPNEVTSFEDFTPLRRAIQLGDEALFKTLLQVRPDLDESFYGLCLPSELTVSLKARRTSMVQALLDLGASPNVSERAISNGCRAWEYSPLHVAAQVGHLDGAKKLLAAGAKPNTAAEEGIVPLHLAALAGDAAMTRLLLSAGALVDAVDTRRSSKGCEPVCSGTALSRAAYAGSPEVVDALIRAGANVNHPDLEPGYNPTKAVGTPLLWAARRGHPSVVELLIRGKADLALGDWQGNRALHAATLAPAQAFAAIATLLKNAKVNVNQLSDEGFAAMHLVFLVPSRSSDAHLKVATLLKLGAAVDPLTPARSTPLMYASGLIGPAYPEAVDLLLKGGANVGLKNSLGYTAVDFARLRGHTEIVQRLCAQAPGACK